VVRKTQERTKLTVIEGLLSFIREARREEPRTGAKTDAAPQYIRLLFL
jgi:hypothetical protein